MSKRTWIMTALVAILSLGIVVPAWAKTPSQTIGDSFKILSTSKTFEFTGSVEYKKTVDKKWLKLKKNAEYAQFWKDSSTKIKLSGAWDAMEESKVKFKLAVEPANADGWTYNSVKFNSFNIMTVGKMFYFLADVNFNGETLNTGSFDINKIVNNWVWVEMSSSSVSEFSGLYNSKYAETAAKVSGQNDFDAAQFKEIIKLYNYYRPFKIIRLADGKIGGKVAQHFRLTVNANGLKNFIRQANKKISGLSLSVSDLKQIDETIAGIRNASVDFWLNKKSGTLLQMSLKNTATQKSTKYSPAITVVLKMTVNFTSIGEPVNIEEPNYSFKLEDVIKEVLGGSNEQTLEEVEGQASVSAEIKARDAKRLADLKQVQTALELYYTDKNAYPVGNNITLGVENAVCLNISGWQPTGCSSFYMGLVPKDPENGAYVYSSTDGSKYEIKAHLGGTFNGLSGDITVSPSGIQD